MPEPTRPRRWPWLLLGPILAVLASFQARLGIDLHNESLKAVDSPEAVQTARLAADFGGDNTLALAFFARSHTPVADNEGDALATIASRLRTERDVRAVSAPIQPDEDLALLTVDLARSADPDAVVAMALTMCPPTLRMVASGAPLAETAIASGVATDRGRLVPLIAVALLALALCVYRSIALAAAAVLPAATAVVAMGALQYLRGGRLDPIGVLLEPVLLTVGVAAAVHYIAEFRRQRLLGHSVAAAVLRTRAAMAAPATMATATTMLGFWSLALHPIPAVASFGGNAGLGTALVHALTLLLLPRWLAAFPGPLPTPRADAGTLARCLANRLVQHRGVVLALVVVTAVGAGHAWTTLRVDNDPMAVLPAAAPFRRDYRELCSRLGGAESFALLVDSGSHAAGADRLMPFVAELAEQAPAVGLGGPARMATDGTVMVPIRLAPSGSAARCALFTSIEQRAARLGWTGLHVAGAAVQIARDSERLVQGQLLGLAATALGLFVGLALGLASVRLALLGMVPNLLPCALLYGGLAWFDRPLTVANAMIGSVMLGLIVDNTIHFLHRFKHARGTPPRRVHAAMQAMLSPVLVSSVVLAAGFAVGAAGAMATTQEFALLSVATVALALVSDALVLPVLLLTRTARRGIA